MDTSSSCNNRTLNGGWPIVASSIRVSSSLLLSSKEIDSGLSKAQARGDGSPSSLGGGNGSRSLRLTYRGGDAFPLCKEDDPKGSRLKSYSEILEEMLVHLT